MRIGSRIAMPGKMFCGGNHAGMLRACDEGCDKSADVDRIFAIRANVDDRIRGVVVYVRHRRVNLLNAHGSRFAAGELAGAARVIRISGRGNCHVPGEIHCVVKAHARSCFQIRGDQEGVFRQLLHAIDEHD